MSARTRWSAGQRRDLVACALGALAAGFAARWWWMCDDAFISLRYAARMVAGKGLTFNDGEVVEGYTNLLWTLWLALGTWLGSDMETWANLTGLMTFGALVGIVWRDSKVPVAAALIACSKPLQAWATGGLETSTNLLLLYLGFRALFPGSASADRPRLLTAGLWFGCAAMTRPDSALIGALCGLVHVGSHLQAEDERTASIPRAVRAGVPVVCGFLALWVPMSLWRWMTYGDLVPNTYYAKSASMAWWGQGLTFVGLACRELPFAPVGVLAGGLSLFKAPSAERTRTLAATASALAFSVYVMKVGGGFMHCRLLLPATLMAYLALEGALHSRLATSSLTWASSVTVPLILGVTMALWPAALRADEEVAGIVDERAHYDPVRAETLELQAQRLRPYLDGLPLRVAFIGGQARLVHRLNPPIAIESETGLTDQWVAHQRLTERGRVGHEKRAPATYLVERRKVHMVFGAFAFRYLKLNRHIPKVAIRLGESWAFLCTWDSDLVAELKTRGAVIPPFEATARSLLRDPSKIPSSQRALTLTKIRRFWPDAPAPLARSMTATSL